MERARLTVEAEIRQCPFQVLFQASQCWRGLYANPEDIGSANGGKGTEPLDVHGERTRVPRDTVNHFLHLGSDLRADLAQKLEREVVGFGFEPPDRKPHFSQGLGRSVDALAGAGRQIQCDEESHAWGSKGKRGRASGRRGREVTRILRSEQAKRIGRERVRLARPASRIPVAIPKSCRAGDLTRCFVMDPTCL